MMTYHLARLPSGDYGIYHDDTGNLIGWRSNKEQARKVMLRILKSHRRRTRREKK